MSTENNSAAGVVTPAATDTSTQTPAAPASVPNVGEPEWLPKRIEQAKKSAEADLLKSLGVSSADEAKKIAADYKAKIEAEKGAETRATEATAKLTAEQARAESLLAVVKEQAARMMVGLSAEQKAAVAAIAGDDPAKQAQTIMALAPTWAAKEAATEAAAKTAAKVADTAPAAGAPNGTTPPNANPRAVYEAARASNPFAAAIYGANNPGVYEPK